MFLLSVATLVLLASMATGKTVRRAHPRDWHAVPSAALDASQTVEFRVALAQSVDGKARLAAETLERADPRSPRYGQWLTQDDVLDLVAPPQHVTDLVVDYCRSHGLDVDGSSNAKKKQKIHLFLSLQDRVATW